MLGRVVEFERVSQLTGRFHGQVFVEGPVRVGRVIVLYELDFRCVGVMGLHKPVHKVGVITLFLVVVTCKWRWPVSRL